MIETTLLDKPRIQLQKQSLSGENRAVATRVRLEREKP